MSLIVDRSAPAQRHDPQHDISTLSDEDLNALIENETSGSADALTGNRSRRETDDVARVLLARLASLSAGDPSRGRVRERIIELYLPMADYLARRFRNRGEPLDDLGQVAVIGLIKSVDGYDASRGAEFTSYAIPTIVGELKRHFRDKGWSVRVPRRLQELKLEITKATGALTQDLGRSPTVADLATYIGCSEEDVIAGLDSANAYSALSLHTPVGGETGDDSAPALVDMLGDLDPGMDNVEDRESLRPLLAQLPERERRIIAMRFFGNMTQSQIAAEIGISQMHVSRLLARSLAHLRTGLAAAA